MEEESAPLFTSIQASITTWLTPTILFIFLNLMIATILFTSNLPNKKQAPDQKPANQNDSFQSKLAGSPSILHRLKSFSLHQHRSHHEPEPLYPVTNRHEQQLQQEALEIAATQYVFNQSFTHEQDLQSESVGLQGHSVTYNNNFDLINPSFDSDSNAGFNQTNEVRLDNAETHFASDPVRIQNEDPPEQETGTVEAHEEDDEFESLDEVYSKITGGNVNRTKSDTLPASGEVPVRLPAKMKKSASLKSAFSHFEEDKIVEARRPATVRERRSPAIDDVEVDSKADDFINKFKHQLKLQRLESIIKYKNMVNRGGAM